MTEYRRITAADLSDKYMDVEWLQAGEWQPTTARIAKMSNGSEVIVTRNAAGGGHTFPKSHGFYGRIPIEAAPVSDTEFPALNGQPVTERHARTCREQGHATHTVDGVDMSTCPRCGDVDVAPIESAV